MACFGLRGGRGRRGRLAVAVVADSSGMSLRAAATLRASQPSPSAPVEGHERVERPFESSTVNLKRGACLGLALVDGHEVRHARHLGLQRGEAASDAVDAGSPLDEAQAVVALDVGLRLLERRGALLALRLVLEHGVAAAELLDAGQPRRELAAAASFREAFRARCSLALADFGGYLRPR